MNTKNLVQMIGQLGFDPEVREFAKGRLVARMSVRTDDIYTNSEGVSMNNTQWHTIVAWGSLAQQVADTLKKGMYISLDGRLVHRNYEGKDGTKRYVTEVVMSSFTIVKNINN